MTIPRKMVCTPRRVSQTGGRKIMNENQEDDDPGCLWRNRFRIKENASPTSFLAFDWDSPVHHGLGVPKAELTAS